MFRNLPGARSSVRGQECCEYRQSYFFETLKGMIEGEVASEAIKLRFAKGEEWECSADAVVRIQGETDSFGCEYIHYCEECDNITREIDDYWEVQHQDDHEQCEWCKKETPMKNLRYTRDIDEGSSGPVYQVCGECRRKQQEQIDEELARLTGDEE